MIVFYVLFFAYLGTAPGIDGFREFAYAVHVIKFRVAVSSRFAPVLDFNGDGKADVMFYYSGARQCPGE